MYFQPYGDDQQLNLNWIINEIINLHKQLDPDYETPSFTQVYPYSNLNRLNLDWILSELKALKELAPEPTPPIDIQTVAEALVALPFDSNTSYQIYDFISRDGEIWRATEAIPAGGEWDSSKWFKTKIGTDLAVLERWINTINNSLSAEIEARQSADSAIERAIANLNNAREDILDDCNNFILGVKKVTPQTLNMPENAYGFIESYTAQNGNWKWQFLTTTQTPQKIFKRASINDTEWTAWVRIADNTDVESLQDALNDNVNNIWWNATERKIKKQKGTEITDVLSVDYTPEQNSTRPISSSAVYELKGSLNTTNQNIASVEATNYASRNYAQYEWLIWNGQLVSAKTNIAQGEQLILGTNIESGSLSSRLYKKAINKTGVITPSEGFTIHEERCAQKGNVVEIHFYIDTQTAFSGEKIIAVISGIDPPPKPIRMMTGAGNAPYEITEPTALYLGNTGRLAAQPVNSIKTVLVDIVYTTD